MINFLRMCLFYVVAFFSAFVFVFPILYSLLLPFPKRYRLVISWPRFFLWLCRVDLGIRYQTIGDENVPTDTPVVFLSKHQSTYETFVYPCHIKRSFCFIYKRSLERIPIFGWGMAALRNIAIDRSKRTVAMQQILEIGTERIKEGRSVLLFPEGTRVPYGKRIRYKQGGVRLALHAGVPIIPIAHNSGKLWSKARFSARPGLVTLSFGPLIQTTGRTPEDILQEVEDWIESEIPRLG